MKLTGRGRRRTPLRLDLLASGEETGVACRLRRTSSRGWGPWVPGVLTLPGGGGAGREPTFTTDDPVQTSLVSGRAGRTAPVPLGTEGSVATRRVRFKGEAFYGADAEVIVLTTDHNVTEVALEPVATQPVLARLQSFFEL